MLKSKFIYLFIVLIPAFAFSSPTPVFIDSLGAHRLQSGLRQWRPPHFENQTDAVGWNEEVFSVPEGLKKQVNFWTDIYTKYRTSQGVIHDSEYVDLIYEVIDFSVFENQDLNPKQKERMRSKLVEQAKDRALARLKKVEKAETPDGLDLEERRLWSYFHSGQATCEISDVMDKNRLRFQLGQSDRMQMAIFLSGRYLEGFERIFQDQGLPKELTRLVFVESSFNVLARSKVGASGLWQLMPSTARPFRVISAAVDGRNDPWTATRIAAKVLKENYQKLQSWPLAVTGYNHGPAGVAKIVKKYESDDLTYLIRNVRSRASFGFASRNFYASFLAALHVEKNAKTYFPDIVWSMPLGSRQVSLQKPLAYQDLLSWFEADEKKLLIFNPHLTPRVRRGVMIPQGSFVHVPISQVYQAKRDLQKPQRQMASTKTKSKIRLHRVSRGESLTKIASEYGVPLRTLLAVNDLNSKNHLLPGQKIRIPSKISGQYSE